MVSTAGPAKATERGAFPGIMGTRHLRPQSSAPLVPCLHQTPSGSGKHVGKLEESGDAWSPQVGRMSETQEPSGEAGRSVPRLTESHPDHTQRFSRAAGPRTSLHVS